jgi:hypothetical protein
LNVNILHLICGFDVGAESTGYDYTCTFDEAFPRASAKGRENGVFNKFLNLRLPQICN